MATATAATDRIGDLLVREGLITQEQLAAALTDAESVNTRIGYSLIKLGFIAESELTRMLARQYRVPAVDLERVNVDPKIIKLVPADLAHKHLVLPLRRVGRTLTLAMANPIDVGGDRCAEVRDPPRDRAGGRRRVHADAITCSSTIRNSSRRPRARNRNRAT